MESLNETPFEIETRVLDALGWRAKCFHILRDKDGKLLNTDVSQLRREFVDAIDRGVAIMPRWGHFQIGYTVFFGYEDDGRKMIGWNYQDNVVEPYAWEDWEKTIDSYIILKEKSTAQTEKDVALATFQTNVKHARRGDALNGRLVGFAA